MRAGRVAMLAALLALAGCKGTDKDKAGGDKPPAGVAGRPKKDAREKDAAPAKGPAWLDDVAKLPGTGTAIPKGRNTGDPTDPNFDAKAAAQDALGGRILDPDGKPARNIYIQIEKVAGTSNLPPLGIYTKNDGYFFATGFQAGQTYELTAKATTADGRKLTGAVQTKVPNPVLLIVLREDVPPPLKEPDASFPPEPKPSERVGDSLPPKAPDGWGPGGRPTTGVPPASIGGAAPAPPAPGGAIPEPDGLVPSPRPIKPENVAEVPAKEPFKPVPANIPGAPPVPRLPALPPSYSPPPGGSTMAAPAGKRAGALTLIDALERPWELDAVKPGSLVLVEFISSTCIPCKQSIPVMKDLQGRYGANGLQVAAVLCDDMPTKQRAAAAAKYARDNNLNYSVFVEPGDAGSVYYDRFGVKNVPYAVLLDPSGRVLWKGHPLERARLEAAIKQGLGK